jgi:tetratricopeptide (TPR) repeat protein
MGIKKDELILYSLGLLKDHERTHDIDKGTFSSTLNIEESTLDVYLSKLKNSGGIERIKKKHPRDIREIVEITDKGRYKIGTIEEKIGREVFTPERHNLPACISVSTLLNMINDPLEKVFTLSLYTMTKRFDFDLLIRAMRTAKMDSSVINVISNINGKAGKNSSSLMETFYRSSMIGDFSKEKLENLEINKDDPDMMLLMAETTYKQGRIEESISLYRFILSPEMHLSHTHWFIASCGLALVTSKMGNFPESIRMLQDLIERTDNKVMKAYARERMARILSSVGEYQKAEELFKSCTASFRSFGIPFLQATGYNNYGILMFRMGKYDEAERLWNMAKKYARESGSKYLEGPVYGNLADIEIQKGNLDQCEKLLQYARECYKDVSDIEGESYVDFNYSLLYLERKDKEKALQYLRRFKTIAYPSPSYLERKEMINVFKERAERNGFHDIPADDD